MHRSLQILSALSLLVFASAASAQDALPEERPIKVGMFGAGAYNIHEGAFATYDGVLQCGAFEKARTLEWQAGNVIDFPIGESFGLSTRLYYHKANGDFTSPNETSPFGQRHRCDKCRQARRCCSSSPGSPRRIARGRYRNGRCR